MQVTFSAYSAIWLHNQSSGIPANGFTNLEFWINGGANSGQYFGISLTGDTATALPITNFVTVTAGQWKLVDIPLGKLGVTNSAVLTDVFFLETLGGTVNPFWIDDVKFTKPAPTVSPDPSQCRPAAPDALAASRWA